LFINPLPGRRAPAARIARAAALILLFLTPALPADAAQRRSGPVRTTPPAAIRGPATMTEAMFDRYVVGAPEVTETYQALRQYYPDAYRDLRSLVIATYNRRGLVAARDAGFNYMMQFVLSKSAAIASAGDADLHDYVTVNAALIRQLEREDTVQCARMVMSGPSPAMRITPATLARLNRVNAVQLRAASRGEANPVRRASPSAEDAGALRAGVTAIAPELVAVFDAGIQSGTPAQQCAAGAVLLEAIASLPPEQGARLITQILRAAAAAVTARQT
jgi:hypothetical protein